MTTRTLTFARMASSLVCASAVLAASGTPDHEIRTIPLGGTIFIGEPVNLDPALAGAKMEWSTCSEPAIGWWAEPENIQTTAPSKIIILHGRTSSFMVTRADVMGYTGTWYLLNSNLGPGSHLFTVRDWIWISMGP